MIEEGDIRVGSIFKLNPGHSSHSKEPYFVEVISIDSLGFNTQLYGSGPDTGIEPHIRRFSFNVPEWRNYHRSRFEEI